MPSILGANTLSSGGYTVDNSCRFDNNAYMQSANTNSTNNPWTFSVWIKRAKIGAEQTLIMSYTDSNDFGLIRFGSDDTLLIGDYVNGSYVTAVANDYSYDVIYERMVQAQGKPGDLLVGISTSGNSKNVLLAMKKAKELGMKTIALTGESGGVMAEYADYLIAIPSKDTPRIQEVHILVGHIICQIVEEELFDKK